MDECDCYECKPCECQYCLKATISELEADLKREMHRQRADRQIGEAIASMCAEDQVELLSATCEAQTKLITRIIMDKMEDGVDLSPYLDSVRAKYNSEERDLELRLSKETAIHKKKAADAINENALLKADVRRLEKLCKRLAEENMRLTLPLKECLDEGIIPLIPKPPLGPLPKLKPSPEPGSILSFKRPETKYVGKTICFEGKQYVVHPDYPLRELNEDGSLTEVEISLEEMVDKEMRQEGSELQRKVSPVEVPDPWLELLKGLNYYDPLDFSSVIEALDMDDGHAVEFRRGYDYLRIKFIDKYGNYMATWSNTIKDMDMLKGFYTSFKELYS